MHAVREQLASLRREPELSDERVRAAETQAARLLQLLENAVGAGTS